MTAKPRWSLLPWRALGHVVQVLEFGLSKHPEDGWRTLVNGKAKYTESFLRHVAALDGGRALGALDEESGMPHLVHAAANALILVALVVVKEAETAEAHAHRHDPATECRRCGAVCAVLTKCNGVWVCSICLSALEAKTDLAYGKGEGIR